MSVRRCTIVVLAAIIFNVVAAISAYAAEATFSWTANEIPPSGYKIYYGYESRNYDFVVDVGLPDAIDGTIISKVEELADEQTYFFSATAYTATEESDYSTEVEYTTPPSNNPDPLLADDLSLQGPEDSVLSATVVTNADPGDFLTFEVDSQPSFGTVSFAGSEGTFTFTPLPNFNGDDSFTFTVSNGTETSSPATATLSISPANDKPTAQGKTIVVNEDGLFSGTLSATDIDGDSLTYTLSTPAGKGVAVVNSNGSFSYRPQANYYGSDSFTFSANDGTVSSDSSTVSITVSSVNDAPTADPLAISLSEGSAYSGQVSGSDPDGNSLFFHIVSTASNGSVSLNTNGSFTYTPDPTYSGTDSFSYNVHDGNVSSNPATVSIAISSVNDAPVAEALAISLSEDNTYTGQVTGSDPDGNSLSYHLVNNVSNGNVSLNTNGSFTYIPDPNFYGSDSFRYNVSDGTLSSNSATVSITVSSINDAPVVDALSISLSEDSTYNGQVTGTDPDGNSLTFHLVNNVSNGNVNLNTNGSFTYIPDPNFYGSDNFRYNVSDGTLSSNPATVSITVSSINDAPVVDALSISLAEDSTYNGQVSGSDPDGNSLSYAVVDTVSHGSLDLNQGGGFTYVPGPNYNGSDSFSYSASDGTLVAFPATVSITVTSVNEAPTADALSISLSEDSTYNGQVSGSDPDGNSLSFAVVSSPTKGSLNLDTNGTFTYIPAPDYSGADSFSYKVNDGTLSSNPATVSIAVTSANDAPVAESLAISVVEDTMYSGQVFGSDIDGDALTFSLISPSSKGSVSLTADGSFTYIPNPDYSGTDSFSFKVSDASLSSATTLVSITVTDVNNAPTATDLAISLEENSSYSGELSGEDSDGDTLQFTVVTSVSHGTLDLNQNGHFTYVPEVNYAGEDSFTFSLSDGSHTSNIATVTVAITEVANEFALEIGELQVTSEWQHVDFDTTFVNPAVIAHSTTASSDVEVLVSIKELKSTGFDIRLNSWNYQNSPDMTETISYLAMEQGFHQLEDDVNVVADCTEVSGGNSFQSVIFSSALPTVPVVKSSIVTNNDTEAVTLRVKDINQYGFSVALQEQEDSDQYHDNEQVCYIAWEKWAGVMDDVLIEIDVLSTSLTDTEATVPFKQQFPVIPMTLAGMQSANETDTATLEITQLAVNEIRLHVLEEQSADSEVTHIEEAVGYFALAPFAPAEDSDQDGLSNAKEQTIGTHPGLADSDNDGMNDGAELQFLEDNFLAASTDSDEDGSINLLDSDSDNDGVLDGDEIAQGSDPTDPYSVPVPGPGNEPSSFRIEVGEIPLTHEPVRVGFSASFTEPVIIANAVTRNGSAPFTIGITNVTSEGFDINIREYNYLNGTHNEEIVSYIVLEKGSHLLEDGSIVEAGMFESSGDASEIYFESDFSAPPVVFTSTVSANETQTVAGRTWDVNTSSFMHKLQRQEANKTPHGSEVVAYAAWTPGVSTADGMTFEVGITPDKVTNKNYEIQLSQNFAKLPFHFAGMQTKDGNDPCLAKIIKAEENSLTVRIEEEKSKDTETKHTKEIVGFLVVLPE